MKGAAHWNWKGDNVERPAAGRLRALRLYPHLPPCQCGGKSERHHKDGNTLNNAPDNIEFKCRRCHMRDDGRLEAFIAKRRERPAPQPKPCVECGLPSNPVRKGHCRRCYDKRRRG